jgi:phenylpyruvate tautomerase PptA (4-oxalocrotonate tautomerase family)
MPTVTVDTSAELGAAAAAFLADASTVFASAAGAPLEHVHILLRCGQMMTWGSRLGGVDGAPHTAQIRVQLGQGLAAAAKNEIVTGVCALLAPHVPKASTQFTFAAVATEDLAIDGLLLPDLIARDFPPAAAEQPPAGPEDGAAS